MVLTKSEITQIAREVRKQEKEEAEQKKLKQEKEEKEKILKEYNTLKENPQEFYEQLLFEMFSIEYDHWEEGKRKPIDWANDEVVCKELVEDSMLWVCYNCDSETFLDITNVRDNIWMYMRAKMYPDRYKCDFSKIREPET